MIRVHDITGIYAIQRKTTEAEDFYMKLENISDVKAFFEAVDQCNGKIELVSPEGDRINLK